MTYQGKSAKWWADVARSNNEAHDRVVEAYVEARRDAEGWREHAGFHLDVHWSTEDDAWVATCAERPSLSYIDASRRTALAGLSRLLLSIERGGPVTDPQPDAARSEEVPQPSDDWIEGYAAGFADTARVAEEKK